MPKSKEDVEREIKKNKTEGKKIADEMTDLANKEQRGQSGKFSGLGERNKD